METAHFKLLIAEADTVAADSARGELECCKEPTGNDYTQLGMHIV